MAFSWDPAKAANNLAKHGVGFELVLDFEWEAALVTADTRRNYGEVRLVALGPILGRLHVLVFTVERRSVRIISLRKANNREIDEHEQAFSEE